MHINSHFTPANFGAGSRPDHAANPSGRAHRLETAPADVEPTDTAAAVTAAAETEETAASDLPGRSVAREARGYSATLPVLEGHNFGWLVSQIAQGIFNPSADETTEDTGEGEATTASAETTAASEEDTTTSPDEGAEAVAELVDDLVDDLLEDGEDGTEVT